MIQKRNWNEFREAGLLWWINRGLHLFGWAIVVASSEEGEVVDAYPARVDFRGFPEAREELGYKRLTEHMAAEGAGLLEVFQEDSGDA